MEVKEIRVSEAVQLHQLQLSPYRMVEGLSAFIVEKRLKNK